MLCILHMAYFAGVMYFRRIYVNNYRYWDMFKSIYIIYTVAETTSRGQVEPCAAEPFFILLVVLV